MTMQRLPTSRRMRHLVRTMAMSVVLVVGFVAPARATLINFDEDAGGTPIAAPSVFISTTALTNLYAPLGVTFEGPATMDGGAILDQAGNFGVNALSGRNFLAFNRSATLSDGGVPEDPEMILFSTPVSSVSIFASGGFFDAEFQMAAFDASDVLVDSDSIATAVGAYGQLMVSHAGGISRIELFEISEANSFVYDDLEFDSQAVPEPATLLLLGLGLWGVIGIRCRQARQRM